MKQDPDDLLVMGVAALIVIAIWAGLIWICAALLVSLV